MPDKRKDGEGSLSNSAKKSSNKKLKTSQNSSALSGSAAGGANNEDDALSYDPVHFIRSHSKNNDPADIQTQIWEVVFEPDPLDPQKTTSKIATCGGNSICIIDVNSGTVLMKYKHKEIKENFYTLAWTTVSLGDEKSNILVSGGIRGEIRMFHPKHKVCFHEWRPVDKKSIAVNSLVFHSEKPTWLFCGTGDGHVTLWDVGKPTLPSYDGVNPVQLLKLYPDYGDVYNIAWTGKNNWLLAGTAAGLVGWNIDDDQVLEWKDEANETKKYKPRMYDFIMPENQRDDGENPIVDSLAVSSEWTIVSKCALHGLIYVWDLKATIADVKLESNDKDSSGQSNKNSKDSKSSGEGKIVEQDIKLLANLKWSDTDNFYMNLGCHKGKGLICCGDDKGSLWLYHLPQFGKDCSPAIKELVQPAARLMWPELQDDHLENSRKVPFDKHDIIIDKVAASHNNAHIVAVTPNNMVCIWKRSLNGGSNSEDSDATAAVKAE